MHASILQALAPKNSQSKHQKKVQCSAIAQSELIQLLVPGSGLFRNCVQSEVPEFVYRSGTHLSQALHSAS